MKKLPYLDFQQDCLVVSGVVSISSAIFLYFFDLFSFSYDLDNIIKYIFLFFF